jgi:exopolysaccharide biosynthesis polyprenyl glycosylphosphotransferase
MSVSFVKAAHVLERALRGWPGTQKQAASVQAVSKPIIDTALSLIALALLSPLMLLSALAIKFDSAGPIVFRQRRVGVDGKTFLIYKFRTMSVTEDGPGIQQAQRDDPRVTRIGRMLRRSSIDELPQLFNVLKGEMSIVGPRPHAVAHDKYYAACIPDYVSRNRIKPGITGWAQVSGRRGETQTILDMEMRIRLDRWYIDNRSISLDFKIIWLTLFEVFGNDAY